jgi:hypothetical protein
MHMSWAIVMRNRIVAQLVAKNDCRRGRLRAFSRLNYWVEIRVNIYASVRVIVVRGIWAEYWTDVQIPFL